MEKKFYKTRQEGGHIGRIFQKQYNDIHFRNPEGLNVRRSQHMQTDFVEQHTAYAPLPRRKHLIDR